jgi:hypothetical protein
LVLRVLSIMNKIIRQFKQTLYRNLFLDTYSEWIELFQRIVVQNGL